METVQSELNKKGFTYEIEDNYDFGFDSDSLLKNDILWILSHGSLKYC